MLPTLFVGHGGGPLPLLGHAGHTELLSTWAPGSSVWCTLHDPSVKAILVISAHHESKDHGVLIQRDAEPSLLFDYGGFPAECYEYTMPNPGCPALADRVASLLTAADIPNMMETGRGKGAYSGVTRVDTAMD